MSNAEDPQKKLLCIYHGNCADGFASAWVVRAALGEDNVEFYSGVYQKQPPDVTDREVLLVDFSYKRPVLLEMATKAKCIQILDHHKSAQADLINLPEKVTTLFDMGRSGAMITWDYFFPDRKPPRLLEHIQDRDLWKFDLENTREIQAAVFSYPYDFEVWDELMKNDSILSLVIEGTAIERKHFKDINELLGVCMYYITINGYIVPAASLPYTLTSDAGHLMATRFAPTTFAACFWNTPGARVYSLRSIPGGMDVSKIAEQYGGGGHAGAAGFSVPFGHELYAA